MATIGVQTMMLKDDIARSGPFETMRHVSKIGYNTAEISAVPMTPGNVGEFIRARTEFGMTTASISAGLAPSSASSTSETLETHFEKIVEDAALLETSLIRMGMLPFPALSSLETVLDFCDRSNEMAARLQERGIGLIYHNHHFEFAKYGQEYLLDIIAERAPLMGIELDVHWIHRGGLNPTKTIRKYGNRVALVHLKDYRIGQLPAEAFAALSKGDEAPIHDAVANIVQFAEVGEGSLDFPSIIDESIAVGAQYLLVEQDEHYGRTPLDCLTTSYENLVELGYQHLFQLQKKTSR